MRTILLILFLPLCAAAQPVIGGIPGMMPFPQNYEALKEALGLTEEQVKKLRDLQQAKAAASQAVYVQISAKQKEVNDLLTAGSSDAAAIGRLEIEISRLRSQVTQQGSNRGDLLNLLTAEQKKALDKLQEAMQLQRAVSEARQLGLLTYPSPVPVRPVAVPLGPAAPKKEQK